MRISDWSSDVCSSDLIGVDGLAGGDIMLTSTGATTVEHAEAANDFTANAASFATGPNSIITGGNIEITAPGAVDLGNSIAGGFVQVRSEEHTSELQSLMRISYAVFCLKKKTQKNKQQHKAHYVEKEKSQ